MDPVSLTHRSYRSGGSIMTVARHFPASIPVTELKALWEFKNGVGSWQDALDNLAWAVGCLNALASTSAPAVSLGLMDDPTAEGYWYSLAHPPVGGTVAAPNIPWDLFIKWLIQWLLSKK